MRVDSRLGCGGMEPAYAEGTGLYHRFRRGYEANAEPLDLAHLREQIRLWIVRASVAVVRHHGANERTSRYCRRSRLSRDPRIPPISYSTAWII
ncbi:hypothetical protein M5W83_08595 [Paenibacillus thiaminolyticus]|uniref:Uncharacterized protein n=1 Tax=Paenibacillus thiaminolyticus TaxID=49283 RepID=A0AAP9IZR4_PANTH|nr:hypothetical protein [Paenibacillus thiaminolyticus]MCY9537816.1 hypothetical protein [Paenibacillus thiaminolyticus]MCY9605108.1 hypothetical protein [Paenibacillus thiaminolyticus]MCY9607205.1 hypothetical protein [Paenibacillus thiaminolyticus]MCY9616330.1 hypothetical protein [Paenibacillus thiaminolyticus]MCY9620017.1 hypothetical protein [Paenibacillus thiaminolyticus]